MDCGDPPSEAMRCAIVVDAALPPGTAANAAAVIALRLGLTRLRQHLAHLDVLSVLAKPDLASYDDQARPFAQSAETGTS